MYCKTGANQQFRHNDWKKLINFLEKAFFHVLHWRTKRTNRNSTWREILYTPGTTVTMWQHAFTLQAMLHKITRVNILTVHMVSVLNSKRAEYITNVLHSICSKKEWKTKKHQCIKWFNLKPTLFYTISHTLPVSTHVCDNMKARNMLTEGRRRKIKKQYVS